MRAIWPQLLLRFPSQERVSKFQSWSRPTSFEPEFINAPLCTWDPVSLSSLEIMALDWFKRTNKGIEPIPPAKSTSPAKVTIFPIALPRGALENGAAGAPLPIILALMDSHLLRASIVISSLWGPTRRIARNAFQELVVTTYDLGSRSENRSFNQAPNARASKIYVSMCSLGIVNNRHTGFETSYNLINKLQLFKQSHHEKKAQIIVAQSVISRQSSAWLDDSLSVVCSSANHLYRVEPFTENFYRQICTYGSKSKHREKEK